MSAWQVLIGSLPIVLEALLTEEFVYHRASHAALAASVYLTFVAQMLAYHFWFRAMEIFPSNLASIRILPVPVVATLFSAWLFGGPFGWRDVVALVADVAALYLVLFRPNSQAAAVRPAR